MNPLNSFRSRETGCDRRSVAAKRLAGAALASLLLSTSVTVNAAESPKYEWSGEWNLRFENLVNPLFPTTSPSFHQHNQRLSSKFELKGSVTWSNIQLVGAFADSRVYLDNDDPTLGRSQVNTLEPVQFNVGWLGDGDKGNPALQMTKTSVGRFVLDHGSRRLLGSGYFRNALNSFDGLITDWHWRDWSVRGFYLHPVSRLPSDAASIDNNDRAFDKTESERLFYGVYAESDDKTWHLQSYWLNEDDSQELRTRNRQLLTVSAQYTSPKGSEWLTDVELALQTGTQRQTTSASDLTDLDHQAWMLFASFGKMIDSKTSLSAVLDWISGDNNSSDNKSNGFDGLYGVRRFDFGPTEVYRSFPRQNLVGIGARMVSKFTSKDNLMLHYGAYWYQKTPNGSDSFLGNQIEMRWRHQITKPLRLEFGSAYMFKGDALAQGNYPDDTAYVYSGFRLQF
ncbi:hypothetical protein FJ444_13265 [Aestuariibacter sp. GS-14]|uniref:alginate export family protein n=1 Tax=Aestuariibacter sp. GS-14 TaxID=2590670 RepID=UPI00112AB7E5|nr:alginate export family protein [Aestuariibacter sp. GS-14]TPV57358.1 hypothetical protein FJ444_13265 [Aestuariibacter sp. GS-14]